MRTSFLVRVGRRPPRQFTPYVPPSKWDQSLLWQLLRLTAMLLRITAAVAFAPVVILAALLHAVGMLHFRWYRRFTVKLMQGYSLLMPIKSI